MSRKNKIVTSPFENIRQFDNDTKNKTNDLETFNNIFTSYDIFNELIQNSEVLNASADDLILEVNEILNVNAESITKNMVFKALFKSINQMISEYKTQSSLFTTYASAFENITNEENIVKILDIMREILKERKHTINDIISNLVKVQKLTNDRIKIDKSDNDDDIDDLLNPDEI